MLTVISGEPLYPLTLGRGRTVLTFHALFSMENVFAFARAIAQIQAAGVSADLGAI